MAYTTIDKPSDYFNTVLYTGTDTSGTGTVTGVGFQPDFVWGKIRSISGQHNLYDIVRGVGKRLISNITDSEETNAAYGYLSAFDSDGFTTSAGSTNNENFNRTGETFVAWNWLASNSTASNTDGALSSTVSANTTSGFSIVKATGTSSGATTIGHGLGVAPRVIIKKQTSQTSNWPVYHASVGASQVAELNLTNAFSGSSEWGSTAPTSTVFTNYTNSGVTAIYYCFAEKKGFSKFGSYTANGSSDNAFCFTGFKPAFVMIKCSSAGTTNWNMFDTKRDGYNGENENLSANLSSAESAGNNRIDILSNGFKVRASTADVGSSGATYIYMCFAESPFTTSTAIPTCAR